MRSSRPKPLHSLCGKPMLVYVLEALEPFDLQRRMVVVGNTAEQISKKLVETVPDIAVELVQQQSPLGTGASVATALAALDDLHDAHNDTDDVLVVPADVPLLRPETLVQLVDTHRRSRSAATVLSMQGSSERPGYGTLLEGRTNEVGTIVRDAPPAALDLDVATGVFCFRRSLLAPALRRLYPDDSIAEVLLSDSVAVLHDAGHRTTACRVDDATEGQGINDRVDLASVEARLRERVNTHWLRRGVTMVDPARTVVDTTVVLASDVTLFPGTLLQGTTVVGPGAEIGPDTHLVDCAVGQGASVRQTVGRDAEVGSFADVGPYAVLQPGASVAPATTTGPFHLETSAADGGAPG